MIYLKTGNIPLNFAFDDEIVQEANSTYQLTFKFPVSDDLFKELKEEVLLLADDLHGEQEFVIFEIVNNHGYCTVYANQVASLLNSYSISELSVDRVTGTRVMTVLAGSIVRDNDFSLSSDIEDEHTLNLKNTSVMNALAKDKHSIIGQWGGDLVRDKYDIQLLKNGGSENESLFMYKKNMKSYTQNKSIKELRTRIHFHKKLESKEGSPEESISVTVDSPLINKYQNVYEYDLEVNDQDVTDLNTLTEYGKKYFRETLCDVVEESIEIDVVGVTDIDVRIFDVVSIFHEKFNIDIRKKVSKYLYSPMGKKLKSIGFGKVQQGLASTISGIVNDEVSNQTRYISSDIDARVKKELKNADLAFDRKAEKLKESINDGIEQNRAETEVIRTNILDQVNSKLVDFKRFESEVRGTIDNFNNRFEDERASTIGLITNVSTGFIKGLEDDMSARLEEAKRETQELVDGVRTTTESNIDSIRSSVSNISRKFDSNGELLTLKHFKTNVEQKDREITTKLTALEQYKNQDGTRQTTLLSLAERKTNELLNREISRLSDTYVAKNTLTETIRGSERKILESIQGVGRNLLLNSSFSKPIVFGSVSSDVVYNDSKNEYVASIDTVEKFRGYNTFKIVSNYNEPNRNQKIGFRVRGGDVTDTNRSFSNKDIMLGFWARASVSGISMINRVGERNNLPHWNISLTTDWRYYSFKLLDNTNANAWNDWIVHIRSKGTVWIAQPKIEYGTVSTPWSPAPEDSETFFTDRLTTYRQEVDRSISELRGIATDGQSKASRLEQTLSGVSATVSSLSGRLNNLKVGGSNYIRNYNLRTQHFSQVNSTWNFYREADPTSKSGYKVKAVCTGVSRSGGFHSPLFDLRPAEFLGREMTWSMDIRTNRDIDLGNLGFEKGGLVNPYRSTSAWSRAVKTFTVNQSGYWSCVWYSNHWRVGDWIEIRDPQLEDGSVATTPRPAPEDEPTALTLYKTERQQTDRQILDKVTTLENGAFKKAEFRITNNQIEFATGKTIDGRTLGSIMSVSPEAVQAITDKMIITPYNENLVAFEKRSTQNINSKNNYFSTFYKGSLEEGEEFFFEGKFTRTSGNSNNLNALILVKFEDNTYEYPRKILAPTITTSTQVVKATVKIPKYSKKIKEWAVCLFQEVNSNFTHYRVENLKVYQKKSASLIVDGSITASQIAANAITSREIAAATITGAEIAAGTVEARHLKANSIESEKLLVNEAFINKLLTNNLLSQKLVASQAFIDKLNAIRISATQISGGSISGDLIRGGKISGTTIEGVTIQGSSKIKIGTHGFLKPSETGLQICSPATAGSSNGVGMQLLGNYGRSGNSPYGLYLYVDPNFYSTETEATDSYLMTVNGYIKARGINNLQIDNSSKGVSIGYYWHSRSQNYGLFFGSAPNKTERDVFYEWDNTLYSLWYLFKNSESDAKLKNNIVNCEQSGLSIVDKLKFKSFDWIDNVTQSRKGSVGIGLIAQDLEKVDSSLVYENGNYLSVDSFKMLNIALKSIQELNEKYINLENKLKEIE